MNLVSTIASPITASQLNIPAKPWKKSRLPRRVLAIRLQAMGDTMACLPHLNYLRQVLPADVRLDMLTNEENAPIPGNIELFNNVYEIGGGRNFKKQMLHGAMLIPSLFRNRYELVLDLQNNELSRMIRKAIMPPAWTEFDRFSPVAGAERYRFTIQAAGLGAIQADYSFKLKNEARAMELLLENGWQSGEDLVVLNPAGAFETRHWPIENFIAFARLWKQQYAHTRFLVLGTSFIREKARRFKEELGNTLIDMVGKTGPAEALAVLQKVKLVLSEDSGLMHMAWCSGIPTMGLFGGTRTDWVRLLGEHTFSLDASDLACGGCMQETCRFGDVHCLSRYSPELVFHHARSLLEKLK